LVASISRSFTKARTIQKNDFEYTYSAEIPEPLESRVTFPEIEPRFARLKSILGTFVPNVIATAVAESFVIATTVPAEYAVCAAFSSIFALKEIWDKKLY
jgi:hypothetical protein